MASNNLFSTSITASPKVQKLLQTLHAQSTAQEQSLRQRLFYLIRRLRFLLLGESSWTSRADDHMRDKFIALDADKCQFIYLLARSIGARHIVEAGTSFGVSTTYLALAVGQNVLHQRRAMAGAAAATVTDANITGKVVATEKEPLKAARARAHWSQAGEAEPDGLKAEPDGLKGTEEIDLLLLDIWTPLALPTLKLVQPRLRYGAVVITDNVDFSKALYKDLLEYIRDPRNGFRSLLMPFSGGMEFSVYLPSLDE
ncbi:MAG: hypothetical protein M1816_003669 [Peltula sp. TS41687]|nr:MAG: hypothetical protein M1816_003669 [Peltula sp. TS41687]